MNGADGPGQRIGAEQVTEVAVPEGVGADADGTGQRETGIKVGLGQTDLGILGHRGSGWRQECASSENRPGQVQEVTPQASSESVSWRLPGQGEP